MGEWVNENLGIGGMRALDGMFKIPSLNSVDMQPAQKSTGKGGDPAPEAGEPEKGSGGGANTVDQNRADASRNKASDSNVTGKLILHGCPDIQAKKGITILNVGPTASGLWYIKGVTHSWDVRNGLTTSCDLVRKEVSDGKGGGGKGKNPDPKKTGEPPIRHADIRNDPKTIIICKRNLDAGSQKTLTYGDGNYIKSFSWSVKTAKKSGADRGKATKSVNQDSTNKAVSELTSTLPGGGKK